jgi:hypothetical protein
MASKQDINKLQLLQNRGLRIILKKPRRTNIQWMLDALKMLSVKQRMNYNTPILIFKIRNKNGTHFPLPLICKTKYCTHEKQHQEIYEMLTTFAYQDINDHILKT